jgi:hypothetical protein
LTSVQDKGAAETDENDADDDQEGICKTIGIYFKFLTLLTQEAKNVKQIYDWSHRYCEKSNTTSADIFKPALELLFISSGRVKKHPTLLLEMAIKVRAELGNLDTSLQVISLN